GSSCPHVDDNTPPRENISPSFIASLKLTALFLLHSVPQSGYGSSSGPIDRISRVFVCRREGTKSAPQPQPKQQLQQLQQQQLQVKHPRDDNAQRKQQRPRGTKPTHAHVRRCRGGFSLHSW
ncbi:unnamed protein product, partial [Ectocarpus sp. 12 AP-2014]